MKSHKKIYQPIYTDIPTHFSSASSKTALSTVSKAANKSSKTNSPLSACIRVLLVTLNSSDFSVQFLVEARLKFIPQKLEQLVNNNFFKNLQNEAMFGNGP